MEIEEAIQVVINRYPGSTRGRTASRGSQYYNAARGLNFHRCRCVAADPDYGDDTLQFVAEGPRGGCLHVGIDQVRQVVSCGPKGYHWHHRPICHA
jgi:hypothetical protein